MFYAVYHFIENETKKWVQKMYKKQICFVNVIKWSRKCVFDKKKSNSLGYALCWYLKLSYLCMV